MLKLEHIEDWIIELVKQVLMVLLISNKWWLALEKAIRVQSIRFSKALAIKKMEWKEI